MLAHGRWPSRGFTLAAVALLAGWTLLALRPAWRADALEYVGGFLALFALYALALALWRERRGWRWGLAIFLSGAAVRVVVLALHPPDLSADIARYAWDGYLLAQGINPFAHAPADPALAALRTDFFGAITYKEIPTIYPPVAQVLFAGAAWLSPGTMTIRLLLVLCDLAVQGVLWLLLLRAALPEGRLLVYAWCPLPVAEVASSGHVEPLGVLLVVLIAVALGGRRRWLAGAAWAAAAMTKLGPVLLAPLVVRRGGWRAAVGAAGAALLLLLPFLDAGPNLMAAAGEYSSRWRFNDFLFAGVVSLCRLLLVESWVATLVDAAGGALGAGLGAWLARFISPAGAARLLAVLLVGGYATWRGLRPGPAGKDEMGFLEDAARVMVLAVLLAPTLHPWYLLWLLPLLTFVPSPPWILLSGTVVLSYLDMAPALNLLDAPSPAAWLEYVPVLGLALWLGLRHGGGLLPAASAPCRRVELPGGP